MKRKHTARRPHLKRWRALDGGPEDRVPHALVGPNELARYKDAGDQLERLWTPPFMDSASRYKRLFIVAFDAAGFHPFRGTLLASNVAEIVDQLGRAYPHPTRGVAVFYAPATKVPFYPTRAMPSRHSAASLRNGIESAYWALVSQKEEWQREEPDVTVSVLALGFGDGATQAVAFSNVVQERGVPAGLNSEWHDPANGPAEPGMVQQAVGLFDPMPLGVASPYSNRLPPSVVSAFQLTAETRHRTIYESDSVLPMGLSGGGRFLNLTLPGCHMDIGGGYWRNGSSVRAANIMRRYLNTFLVAPKLGEDAPHGDPRMNVLHQPPSGELAVIGSMAQMRVASVAIRIPGLRGFVT